MRLFFVHPHLSSIGGSQLALTWLVKGLAQKGHEVRLCAGSDSGNLGSQLARSGIEVSIIRDMSRGLGEKSKDCDLIVAGNYPATRWIRQGTQQRRAPVLWNCNEPPRWLYEEVMSVNFLKSAVDPKFYFPWSLALKRRKFQSLVEQDQQAVGALNRIVAISDQTARWIRMIYGRSVPVVKLGIGDMQLQAQTFPPDPFVFLSPAGLDPIKNFKTILQAFRILRESFAHRQAKLWITGSGAWRAEAESLANHLHVRSDVEFLGTLPRSELIVCYAKCHAVVFVPLDEPFGLVSCEAGLAGKPVIASNHGGPSETVADRETGILVDPLDAKAIAKAMATLFQNRNLCVEMGKQGQRKISKEFSFNRYLDEFEKACFDRIFPVSSET